MVKLAFKIFLFSVFLPITFCVASTNPIDKILGSPKKQYHPTLADIPVPSSFSQKKSNRIDLSGLSNSDLKALQANQVDKVSDAGLKYLSMQFCPDDINSDQLQKCTSFSVELARSNRLLPLVLNNFVNVGNFCVNNNFFKNPIYAPICQWAAVWAGLYYFHGEGSGVNYGKSFYWLSKSNPALDSNGNAQFAMGFLYGNGLGTSLNYQKAIYWYNASLAVVPNGAGSLTNLSAVYQKVGDYQLAYQSALKAARLGSALAQYNVANFYYTGQAVLADEVQAYAWASLAVANGFASQDYQNARQLQEEAIFLRDSIKQDLLKNGRLQQAESLAKKYYDLYVLGKAPPQPKKTFLDKLQDYWKS